MNDPKWEEEFDKRFPILEKGGYWRSQSQRNRMVDFISSAVEQAREEERGKVKQMGYVDSEGIIQLLDEKAIAEIIRLARLAKKLTKAKK